MEEPLAHVFERARSAAVRDVADADVAVTVRATPGGTWAYYEAGRGRCGYLCPCGDAKHAADDVDGLLKHRMFPSSW